MPRAVFDIFLSSTSADLQAYRAKVSEMIARMRQTTIRMETFGAKPMKPLRTCQDEVQKCDALIVIVGHRYGWVPPKEDDGDGIKSITWWEVHWALDAKKPVYAFLVDPKVAWTGEREQDRLKTARTESMFIEIGRAVSHLQKFRDFLDTNTTRELFTSADDLAAKVATSLHDWLLEQAVTAARATYLSERSRALPSLPSPAAGLETLAEFDYLYWQEQVHLLSAQRIAESANGVRMALIAGRANTHHPALCGASIKQFDARLHARQSPSDDYTTALAALLVANGSASPYLGVAPKAHLLVLHVLDNQYSSSTADMLAALDAAIREGAQVVCLPLGGFAQSEVDRIAYRHSSELGVVIVCPSGNNSSDKPVFPAAYPDCISAGVVDARNSLATFSNYGDWVTTTAPGVDFPVAVGEDRYEKWAGSSFACGILAGVAALMLKVNPKLTPGHAKDILRTVGLPVLSAETTKMSGSGHLRVVDACEAVRRASENDMVKQEDRAVSRKTPRQAGRGAKTPRTKQTRTKRSDAETR
jgi:Subtilase family/Domain of unknown function (DUF4062)